MKTAPTTLAEASRAIPEKDWMAVVIEAFRAQRWLVFHPYDSRRSVAGYPDVTAVNPRLRRVVWIETKRVGGRLTPEQDGWRVALLAAGQEWYCWTPADWLEVVAVAGGAVPAAAHQQGRALKGMNDISERGSEPC